MRRDRLHKHVWKEGCLIDKYNVYCEHIYSWQLEHLFTTIERQKEEPVRDKCWSSYTVDCWTPRIWKRYYVCRQCDWCWSIRDKQTGRLCQDHPNPLQVSNAERCFTTSNWNRIRSRHMILTGIYLVPCYIETWNPRVGYYSFVNTHPLFM